MKSRLLLPLFATAAWAVALPAPARAADDTTSTVKLSDPAKAGTLKISLGRSDLRIQGADTNEITVRSDAPAATSKPRKDGLRVISASTGFGLKEQDNVVTLDAAVQDMARGGNFQITVPRSTSLVVQNAWGGDISCAGLTGDIEINSMQGEIKLDDVAGGVVVSTMNGEIQAGIRELQEKKPLSFTSMNGEVIIRLPESAKANVRLRTQNGSVLTDFDESVLVTKTETAAGFPRGKTFSYRTGGNKVLTTEIQDAIREATQMSATAVREALEAVKEGFEAARLDAEDARRQVDDARRQMEKARRDADRERQQADRDRRTQTARAGEKPAVPAAPAVAGSPATPPIGVKVPTISGGKLVTGSLNGGGPEISVATMHGDVILRKIEAKR